MPSMRHAAAMAGVSVVTLIRWNHRHAICPVRGGLNLTIDDTGLARLLHMSELVARGVPEPEAAVAAKSLDNEDLPHRGSDLVAAARSKDVHHLDTVLTNGLATGPLAERIDDWLMPELRRVGEAWASGDLTHDQEEFVSSGTLAQLYACQRAIPHAPAGAPLAVLGLPPGEVHEIPLLATGILLRAEGIEINHLGANVSLPDWENALQQPPEIAVLAARTPAAARGVAEIAALFERLAPACQVWVGGRFAHRVRGVQIAPDRLGDAARAIAAGPLDRSVPVA